jgi:glyoxylase-like metal-dependent hydrolase (beta-lactamase superfamily II)/rhodanese-related sulfurtransferase
MNPIQLFDPDSSTYTYLLFDEISREALIIDPVDAQLERDLATLRQYGLKLAWTVETHAHADHITSAGLLAEHAGAKTAAPAGCGITTAAMQLQDGDTLTFGGQHIEVRHTPGHTEGSMSFMWRPAAGSHAPAHVFTGDTLLINGCGRADFQSGSAESLYRSITQRLFTLPDTTVVWPGHDYKGQTQSTIGHEKAHNVRLAGKTEAQFVALMNGLNLPKPKRMEEAVPANQTSGLRHDADSAGSTQAQSADQPRPAPGYAGDVTPQLAWQWMQSGEAVLVDARSDAEREWVGFVPGAKVVAWKQWPGMAMNPGFDDAIRAAVARAGSSPAKAMLLCRSGVRSIAAAKRATELGIEAYNILEGFEGDPDSDAHRGRKGGWRHHGLPWRQN